jgi:predicted PurR-regulated permease PerM
MGQVWKGIGLALFCSLVVGTIDNILRPVLVGRDTQMHELLIFFSTLGGLLVFGATGFILGPVLAALFVTAWEMFGKAFQSELAEPVSPLLSPEDIRGGALPARGDRETQTASRALL